MSSVVDPNNLKQIIRIILMGTPDFALPGFKAIKADSFFNIVGVFTQADKASGRHRVITAPPVKQWAQSENLKIYQPEKIKTATELIKELKPDLILVIAYGKIIPADILNIPTHGCINVHGSLLPKYRGAACLNAPILNGDSISGLTIMLMNEGLDTGDILRQFSINLDSYETLSSLHDKLAALSAEKLCHTLKDWVLGKIQPQAQKDDQANYIGLLKKNDGLINWSESANKIERTIRAFNPWPGTFSYIRNLKNEKQILKILAAQVCDNNMTQTMENGQLFLLDKKLQVKCGQNSLHILKLQIAGGKKLSDTEFLTGHKEYLNQILG